MDGKGAARSLETKTKSFVDAIHQAYETLSGRERQVADFILEMPGEISLYPASELAQLIGVSNSTVTRFVRRIGYSNYDEMRQAARSARQWGSPLFLASGQADENPDADFLRRFMESEQKAMAYTLAGLSPQLVDELSTALLEARHLGFLGFRNSHHFASYARWQFIQFRKQTRMIPGPGETVAERIADLTEEDLVVVIGVRRIIGNLKRYMSALSERGVKVLLLTDPSARVTPKYATWTITCQVENEFVFDCYAGVLAVVRLLAYETFLKSGKEGRAYLKDIEDQHSVLGEFE